MPSAITRIKGSPARLALFAALTAVILTLTAFESAAHGHVPAVAGWHDASPHGTSTHDEFRSCSICRLAHESSVASLAPADMSRPERVVEMAAAGCLSRSLVVLARERSPRAPPRDAAC